MNALAREENEKINAIHRHHHIAYYFFLVLLWYLQAVENTDNNFKRKLSKREKKEQKKKEKLQKLNPNADDTENHVAEKLYTGKYIQYFFPVFAAERHANPHFTKQQCLLTKKNIAVNSRTSRDIVHSLHFKSWGRDEKTSTAEARKEASAVSIERRRTGYRWNVEDLRWESLPRCALQNTPAVDTRLCAGRRTRDVGKIRHG